jgi:hypothetical protein
LSAFFHSKGVPADYTEMILEKMNEVSANPVPLRDIQTKIDGAYRVGYAPSLCREQGLDVHCSADCALFEWKAEQRGVSIEQLRRRVGLHK